jgi:hypothetical protein
MADILVVEKQKAQRAIESAAVLILPPSTGWALWRNFGPSPLIALAVVVVFFAVPTLGNVVAGALTNERITVEERVRRIGPEPAALAGALFGTISVLAMWMFARLAVFDPRRRAP